jgi:uncharacterized protein YjbJ (UPF0337 family)
MADTKGKAKEAVGWLTADRDVEAEGRAEQESDGTPTDEKKDEARQDVRTQYGETPDGEDAPDRLR